MMTRPEPRAPRPRWPWITYSLTALGVAVAFGGLFVWGLASGQSANRAKITDLQKKVTELCAAAPDEEACRLGPLTTVIVIPSGSVGTTTPPTTAPATTTVPATSSIVRVTTTSLPPSSASSSSTSSTSSTVAPSPPPAPPSTPTTACLLGLVCR